MQTEQSPVDLSDSIGKINFEWHPQQNPWRDKRNEEEATTTNYTAIPATGQTYFYGEIQKVESSPGKSQSSLHIYGNMLERQNTPRNVAVGRTSHLPLNKRS